MPREVYATCEPADRAHSRYLAKRSFIEAIQRCTPQLLDDLSGEPFQAFRESGIYLFNQNGTITLHHLDLPKLNRVMPRICECLLKHNLHFNWLHDYVLLTFHEWIQNPKIKWPDCQATGEITWREPGILSKNAMPKDDLFFRFEYQFSDPTKFPYNCEKDRQKLKKEITNKFQQKLKEHFDRLRKIPEGFVSIKTRDSERHFEWLSLYLIEGLTHSQIAERYDTGGGLNTQAIGKAIREVARQTDVVLPNRRGKPKPNLENCVKRFF